MEERFTLRHANLITGTFVLAIVAALVVAVVLTGHSQHWFRGNVTLRIVLPETGAAGIRQGSDVYFLGTHMGTVTDVSVDPDGRMEARVNIRRDFFRFVRADSSAVVKRKFGMMGDAYFEITRGVGQTLPEKNASIVCNELEPSALETALEEIRSEAVPALKKLSAGLDSWTDLGTELGNASRQLHQLIARMDNIASGVEQGEGTVGRLLVDRTVADELEQLLSKSVASMDELKLILDNIRQASTNFPAITESVHQSAQDLPAVLAQAQHTLQEIERLARGMQRHWLLRGAVRQADADAAASNQTTRAKTP